MLKSLPYILIGHCTWLSPWFIILYKNNVIKVSQENSPEAQTETHKNYLFSIKTSMWEKWWLSWLKMANGFILCDLLWKVQKSHAVNREGSFNIIFISWSMVNMVNLFVDFSCFLYIFYTWL